MARTITHSMEKRHCFDLVQSFSLWEKGHLIRDTLKRLQVLPEPNNKCKASGSRGHLVVVRGGEKKFQTFKELTYSGLKLAWE